MVTKIITAFLQCPHHRPTEKKRINPILQILLQPRLSTVEESDKRNNPFCFLMARSPVPSSDFKTQWPSTPPSSGIVHKQLNLRHCSALSSPEIRWWPAGLAPDSEFIRENQHLRKCIGSWALIAFGRPCDKCGTDLRRKTHSFVLAEQPQFNFMTSLIRLSCRSLWAGPPRPRVHKELRLF